MGTDTHLYLNTRWGLDDIKKVIERTQNAKVEVIAHSDNMLLGYFHFTVGERQIFVGTNCQTPIGTATYLSLSANEQAHKIFKDIASILGGILEYYDSDGKCEMIRGAMDDDDGIPYFVKYAILVDGIQNHDFKGLIKSINKWYDEYDKGKKPDIIDTLTKAIAEEG